MEEVVSRKKLGELIRRNRKQNLLSQFELAEKAGMEDTHLGRIERGEHGITLDTFGKLVKVLNIEFDFRDLL